MPKIRPCIPNKSGIILKKIRKEIKSNWKQVKIRPVRAV